jgi:4-amino-4-deoxy-L-arabinose transferase-like glycosyltransferase
MNISKQGWGAFWRHPGHILWILPAYLPFLGGMSVPLTGDQKVYLSTALEMRQAGEWLRPLLFGQSSYFKPPLQYWATLLGWKLFGLNFWGALVPSVLCVVLTAWLLGEIAYRLNEKRLFVNAGLWFAATLGTLTYGTTAQMEIYVVLFYAGSWWMGLRFLADPIDARDWRWLYGAFAVAGLASLVKSPLYSVFWVLGYLSYLVILGEWELFRSRHLYLAWLLGVILGSAWYVAILAIDRERFVSHYLLQETWEKKEGNGGSPLSLWGALLYFCFPFTPILVLGRKAIRRNRRSGHMLKFALCWAWPPAIFFTFYPYRIKPYLYILLPMLAILVDWIYYRAGRTRAFARVMWLTGVLAAAALGALALVLARSELVEPWIIAGLAGTGLWALFCCARDWMRGLVLCVLAAMLFVRAGAVSLGERDVAGLREAVAARPDAPIAMLDERRNIWHEVGLLSVAIGKPIRRLENLQEAAEFLRAGGLLALSDEQAQDDERVIQAKLLGQGEKRDLVIRPWSRWKPRGRFPFKELIRGGRAGVPDFEERLRRNFGIMQLSGP